MKPGFSLIELIIATLIATIIAGALWSSYYQTNRSVKAISNLIALHEKAALVIAQLERDVSGAFIPWQKAGKEQETKQPESQSGEQSSPTSESTTEKKAEKKITHIFYSANKEKNLETLTFITSNPLQVYWGNKTGSARPRIARVVYRLVPQQQAGRSAQEPAYQLMRQESSNLDFNAYKTDAEKPIRSYEVIDGIKELTITYGTFIEKKETENTSPQPTEKEGKSVEKPASKNATEYITFPDWNLEDKKEAGEGKRPQRAVPHEVFISLSLWDAQRKRSVTFQTTLLIIPDVEAAAQDPHKNENPESEKPQGQNNAQPQPPLTAQRPSLGFIEKVFPTANKMLQEITTYNSSLASAS